MFFFGKKWKEEGIRKQGLPEKLKSLSKFSTLALEARCGPPPP